MVLTENKISENTLKRTEARLTFSIFSVTRDISRSVQVSSKLNQMKDIQSEIFKRSLT